MSSTVEPQQVTSNPALAGKKTKKILRKIQPAAKPIKKYIWLAGHGITLGFGGIYIVLYALRWFLKWYWIPNISYRLSFLGVIASYTISVITTFGDNVPSYHTLLATENFQSLCLAFIWLISRASAFKLFPYYTVSLLQIADTYKISAILKLESKLGDFAAFSEVLVFLALLFDTLLFRGTSGFALVIYVAFYWLRINFSPYTQTYILSYVKFIDDKIISKQKPEIQEKWNKVKEFIEFRRNQTTKAIEQKTDVNHLSVPASEQTKTSPATGLSKKSTNVSLSKKPTNISTTTSSSAGQTTIQRQNTLDPRAQEINSVSSRLNQAANGK